MNNLFEETLKDKKPSNFDGPMDIKSIRPMSKYEIVKNMKFHIEKNEIRSFRVTYFISLNISIQDVIRFSWFEFEAYID